MNENLTTWQIIAKVVMAVIRFIVERATHQKEKAAQRLAAWQDRYTARRNERIRRLELMKSADDLADKK